MSRIVVNVGGVYYETTTATLQKSPILGQLCDDAGDEIVFVDRDGGLFSYILSYLRTDTLVTPPDEHLLRLIGNEAVFYQLSDLRCAAERMEALVSHQTSQPNQMEGAIRELSATMRALHDELRDRSRHRHHPVRKPENPK